MFMCCCAKNRKDNDESTIGGFESKAKNTNRILIEFVSEEAKIGLREVNWTDLVEQVLLASNKGEIPKKELHQVYKNIDSVNQNVIKNYLVQDFFFTDNTRVKFEANKIIFFNLLYSGGKDTDKANFLFNLIENKSSSCVHNNSQNLLLALEHLTTITTIIVGEIINTNRRFSSDNDE